MKQLSGVGLLLAACGSGSSPPEAILTLGSGTVIEAATERAISSRTDTAGGTFTASVSRPVMDGDGLVVIPAGSTLHLTIAGSTADGKISVVLSSVRVGGKQFPVSGDVTAMAQVRKGGVVRTTLVDTGNRELVVVAGTPIIVTLGGPVTISFR